MSSQPSDTTRNPRPGEENGKGTTHSSFFSSAATVHHVLSQRYFSCSLSVIYILCFLCFRLPLCYAGDDAGRDRQRGVHRERRVFREHVRDE